ncbi:hypothetical protein RHSIM_Rhsim08G0238500 [Rhododendron simsii]|uniref:F-box domain-containing protein n=1 Tax=Rhododendron simsii TaxID=118357 RepID=A0A834GL79_RHOSS|nr:hypothetical protein RHSIM_Rhsim08G0238500 [Rhododendron simsii]
MAASGFLRRAHESSGSEWNTADDTISPPQFDTLPEELLIEVLLRLPLEDPGRCGANSRVRNESPLYTSLKIFYSKTREWTDDSVISWHKPVFGSTSLCNDAVVCNGMLHWRRFLTPAEGVPGVPSCFSTFQDCKHGISSEKDIPCKARNRISLWGDYDECIEKAKASADSSSKKQVKYARREDAILHALELESAHQSKDHRDVSSKMETSGGKQLLFEEPAVPHWIESSSFEEQ